MAKRPKQTKIPGTEAPLYKDVSKKAAELYEVRSERMDLSKQEARLAGELLELMKKHGLDEYTEDGITTVVVPVEEKVKVKRKRDDEEE